MTGVGKYDTIEPICMQSPSSQDTMVAPNDVMHEAGLCAWILGHQDYLVSLWHQTLAKLMAIDCSTQPCVTSQVDHAMHIKCVRSPYWPSQQYYAVYWRSTVTVCLCLYGRSDRIYGLNVDARNQLVHW